MPVYFHTEDVSFSVTKSAQLKAWINHVIKSEKKKTGDVNFIFCSDDYVLAMNRQYLKHDYYTDVITFNQSDDKKIISGDIYISVDRVKENAINHDKHTDNRQPATNIELQRVMIHGVLHLLGYDDKKAASKKVMTMKEDECLKMI